jgi:hypothetical protein
MKRDEFEKVLYNQLANCTEVLIVKAAEYATEDRLHNFRVAAKLQGTTMRAALAGMMAKHTTSVYDMCVNCDGRLQTMEKWDEKITDHINYLLLLRAIIEEESQE